MIEQTFEKDPFKKDLQFVLSSYLKEKEAVVKKHGLKEHGFGFAGANQEDDMFFYFQLLSFRRELGEKEALRQANWMAEISLDLKQKLIPFYIAGVKLDGTLRNPL